MIVNWSAASYVVRCESPFSSYSKGRRFSFEPAANDHFRACDRYQLAGAGLAGAAGSGVAGAGEAGGVAVPAAGGVAGAGVVVVGAFDAGMNIHTASATITTTANATMTFLFMGSSSSTVLTDNDMREVVRRL